MEVGVALPATVDGLWARDDTLERWARAIDAGPFASVGFGGRIAGDTPEIIGLAGALAAWTDRATLRCAVTPQLYGTIWLAKALVTIDRLSRGRLEVAFGVGARDEDYRALVIDPATQNVQQLATRARRTRWVWAGDHLTDSIRAVGPRPVRPEGPPLLISSFGVQGAISGADWADGVVHTVLGTGPEELTEVGRVFTASREHWAEAGRPAPRLVASLWFAMEETAPRGARAQMEAHLREYVDWMPAHYLDEIAPRAGFVGTVAELADTLRTFEELGADEVLLIPTGLDVAQVDAVADAVTKTSG